MIWPFNRKKTDNPATGRDIAGVHNRMDHLEEGIRTMHLELLKQFDGIHTETHAHTRALGQVHNKLDKALGKRKKG